MATTKTSNAFLLRRMEKIWWMTNWGSPKSQKIITPLLVLRNQRWRNLSTKLNAVSLLQLSLLRQMTRKENWRKELRNLHSCLGQLMDQNRDQKNILQKGFRIKCFQKLIKEQNKGKFWRSHCLKSRCISWNKRFRIKSRTNLKLCSKINLKNFKSSTNRKLLKE
jgi:hypothetical protein